MSNFVSSTLSTKVIKITKSNRMRLVGHAVRETRKRRTAFFFYKVIDRKQATGQG